MKVALFTLWPEPHHLIHTPYRALRPLPSSSPGPDPIGCTPRMGRSVVGTRCPPIGLAVPMKVYDFTVLQFLDVLSLHMYPKASKTGVSLVGKVLLWLYPPKFEHCLKHGYSFLIF
jgi:hypothetical protein